MKSLKYRGKIGRNVPFQDEKLSIVDEKMDEKKKQLIKYIISDSKKSVLTDLNI